MHKRGTRAFLLGMADGANVNQILRYKKSCLFYAFTTLKTFAKIAIKSRKNTNFQQKF